MGLLLRLWLLLADWSFDILDEVKKLKVWVLYRSDRTRVLVRWVKYLLLTLDFHLT